MIIMLGSILISYIQLFIVVGFSQSISSLVTNIEDLIFVQESFAFITKGLYMN